MAPLLPFINSYPDRAFIFRYFSYNFTSIKNPMIYRKLAVAVVVLLIAGSCRTKKKTETTTVAVPETITLDTLTVTAKEPEPRPVYRESNPITSDILHTKLEVNFDWKMSRMNGRATLKVKPYFQESDKLVLHARGMDITSLDVFEVAKVMEQKKAGAKTVEQSEEVWHKLTNSSYKYENDSLKIELGRLFAGDEYYYVVIGYVAKPNELKSPGGSNAITEDKGLYFVNPSGDNPYKMPQIWTQGETQASSAWFPTIDSPNEKMTQEILMTVDEKYTTLSNGILVATTKQSGGFKTDHWKLDQPHAPYLAMMAVGEFVKVTDSTWKDKEISYYVEKEYAPHAKAIFSDTREMVDFYSKMLGVDYVWPKYSQVVARDYVSGAMENTSATLHGDFMVYQTTRETIDGKKGNPVIAHELFHQWFGDLVTSESWSNLPLNESFATYGEYLWEEYKNGRDAADEHHWQSRMGYMQSKKEVDLIRFNYEDKEDMFDAFSYNKGGQVLHMLRKAVGDPVFFASLKHYLETNKFKPVEIHHLRLAFEEISGRDLNWFFDQWFLNKGRPDLKVSQKYIAADSIVELSVEQVQDLKVMPLYRLPVYVDLYTNGKSARHHITITEHKQTFRLKSPSAPQLVNFDAERQLLCDLQYRKSAEEYIFQYKNAPLFNDRLEALKELEGSVSNPVVYKLFSEALLQDKYPGLRSYAVSKLEKVAGEQVQGLKALMLEAYNKETNTVTKARILSALNKRFLKEEDVIALNNKALTEQSYAICAEALTGLSRHNPQVAMQKAAGFEKEPGRDIIFAISNLYAEHGSDGQLQFYHNAIPWVTGFDILPFLATYTKAAKRCTTSANVMTAAKDLELIGKGANKYTKFATTKGIKDIATAWSERETTTRQKIESLKREGKDASALERELQQISDTKVQLTEITNRIKQ
jgi:aminopeptidase N